VEVLELDGYCYIVKRGRSTGCPEGAFGGLAASSSGYPDMFPFGL